MERDYAIYRLGVARLARSLYTHVYGQWVPLEGPTYAHYLQDAEEIVKTHPHLLAYDERAWLYRQEVDNGRPGT